MIHYHGLPITPDTVAVRAVDAGHAFVSFAHSGQLGIAAAACQSFAIDNGAFSAWKAGRPVTDWSSFYEWAGQCKRIPSCDFAVIPDVIDGSENENDSLLTEWPLPNGLERQFGTCMRAWIDWKDSLVIGHASALDLLANLHLLARRSGGGESPRPCESYAMTKDDPESSCMDCGC